MKARIKHLICAGICGTLLLALVFCMGTVSVFAAENQENSLVNNWGMTLNDEIIVKFQMSFTPEILEDTGAYVEVSVGDHSYEVPVAQIEDHLPVPVFATQMTEVITLCVVDGSGGRGEENSFTVKEYCQALLGNVAYASYHPLVKELLNYGNAAQKYFDYNPGDLAGTDVDLTGAGQNAVPTTGTQFALDDRSSILDCYGASLVYRDKIAIRFYFKGEGSLTDCTFAVTGASGEPVINEAESYVEVGDIVPQDFDKAITLTVTDQLGKNIDVTYCPMDYIIRMSCNGSDNSKALVKALYNYHLAAKNFVPVESFTVSFDMNYEGATETPEAITVAAGGAYGELPVPQRENYDFGGWYKDAACSGDAVTDETTVSASHTLYAKWIAVEPDPEESPAIVAGTPENLTYATAEQKAAVGINASKTMYRYTKAAGVSANDADPASIYFSNENGYDYISFDFYFVSMPAGQQDGKPYMAMKAYKYLTGNTSNTAQDANTLDLTIVNKATGEANTEYVGTETWGKVEMNTWYTMTCKVTDWAKLNLVLWSSASAEMYFANVRGYEDPNAVADTTVAMTPGGKVTVGQWPSQFTFPVSSGESIALTANGNTVGQEHYTVANGNLVLFDSYYKTFADGTYTFAVNNTAYTLIKKTSDFLITEKYLYKASGSMNYYAWPSVAEIGGGKLLAVASQRMEHVDPYGRVVGFLSEDGGNTWSEPFVIADTLLDDRDAGIVYWQGKIIVTWFTHSRNYYLSSGNSQWIAHCNGITDAQDADLAGGLITISDDEGKTWSTPKKIDVFTPHGIQIMPDGNLGYIGYVGYDRSKCGFTKGIGMITSTDGINWSAVTSVAGTGYEEPGYVFVDESTVLVYLRKADGLYLAKSTNGGANFTTPVKIMSDVANTPVHILTTSSGALVMTYGRRSAPYGLQAKISFDKGDSWSETIALTDDGFEWDLGYSCSVELPDGTIYTNYYQKQESSETNTCIMGVHWKLGGDEALTVTFDSAGGSPVAPISGKFGTAVQMPADPTREGYTFSGWYTAAGEQYTSVAFTQNITVYAKWKNDNSIPDIVAATPENLTLAGDDEKTAVGIDTSKTMYRYTKAAGVSANNADPASIYFSNENGFDYISFDFYFVSMPAGQQDGKPYMAMKAYKYLTGDTTNVAQDATTLDLTIVNKETGELNTEYVGSQTWGKVEMNTWYTMTCKVTDWAKLNLVLWSSASAEMYFTNLKGYEGEPPALADMIKVTFDSRGGTSVATLRGTPGNSMEAPADPTRSGYVFQGWYTASGEQFAFTVFKESLTVYAKWKHESSTPAVVAGTPANLTLASEDDKTAVGVDASQTMYRYTKAAGVSANDADPASIYFSNENGYDYISFDFYFVSMPAGQQDGKPYMAMKAYKYLTGDTANVAQDATTLGLTIVNKETGKADTEYVGSQTWGKVEMNTWYTLTCKVTDWAKLNMVLWSSASAEMYFTNIQGG